MMQKRLTAKVGTPQPPPQRGVPIYERSISSRHSRRVRKFSSSPLGEKKSSDASTADQSWSWPE